MFGDREDFRLHANPVEIARELLRHERFATRRLADHYDYLFRLANEQGKQRTDTCV